MSAEYGVLKPRLDARLTGSDVFTATANSTTDHYYTFTFDNSFNGVEIYSEALNLGDKIELSTEYYVPPLSSWKRYKKFGKGFNIFPKTHQKYVLFPTKPSVGVRVKIVYTNNSNADVDFAVNLFLFVDQQKVDTSTASEGENW